MADDKSLAETLESTGLPVTFVLWGKNPPPLPYIVYLTPDSENFGADNMVYHSDVNYDIELYSDKKDPASEVLIEAALAENGIYYEKSEVWIASENMYQVVYSI